MIVIAMLISVPVGCNSKNSRANGGKISIVTTIFPEYDWVRQIVGEQSDNVEITMLLNNGVDLHSYQPTADDLIKIKTCDLFIYVGGESDKWVDDVLKQKTNKIDNLLRKLRSNGKICVDEQRYWHRAHS